MKLLNKIFGNDTFLLDNALVVWKCCNCPHRAGLFSEKHTCNRIFCRMERCVNDCKYAKSPFSRIEKASTRSSLK